MTPHYQIVIRNKDGDEVGEFTDWTDLIFSDRLNNYGSCEFKVPVSSENLIELVSLRRYETLIKRNGVIVWAGEQTNRFGQLQANSPNYITVISHTFVEMLNAMYTTPYVRYDQIDEGEILKNLVDDYQAQTGGDLGLTFGEYETGELRDREYFNQNILEAFVNMSEVINGPDFYITHDKEINIVPTRGIDKSALIVLEWGVNLNDITISEDFSTPANYAIVLGAGFGSEQIIGSYVDTAARGIYGLRQQRSSEIDVGDTTTLDAKAEGLVRKYKQPIMIIESNQFPNTKPSFGSLGLGDTVRKKVREGIYDINNRFRIYAYNVKIDKDGVERVSYTCSQI